MMWPVWMLAAVVDAFVVGNDFDPDGDSFSIVKIVTPAHGTVAFNFTNFVQLRTQRRVLRHRNHHLHHSGQHRIDGGRCLDGVG